MKSTDKLVLTGVGIIVVIGMMSAAMTPKTAPAIGGETAAVASPTDEPVSVNRKVPVGISSIASGAYTRDQYPSTFQKFGSAIQQINVDRLAAAKIASLNKDCDYVENSQIITRSPKQNRRYWVECRNLTRLFFDEESLARNEAVTVQTKAKWIRDGLKDW